MGSADESARWQQCLEAMALTGEQQEQLLLNRRAHLQRMRAIYQERHNLNMQVGGRGWWCGWVGVGVGWVGGRGWRLGRRAATAMLP